MAVAKKPKPRSRAELERLLAIATNSRTLIDVQMSGALLTTIADLVAAGKMKTPLCEVLKIAEERAQAAAWRQKLHALLG